MARSVFKKLQDGHTTRCNVDGVEILLCRVSGQYYAVSNRCSHAKQVLSEGKLRGFEISCPLHGARFDIRDGRCLGGPATNSIDTYQVVVDGDDVIAITASCD